MKFDDGDDVVVLVFGMAFLMGTLIVAIGFTYRNAEKNRQFTLDAIRAATTRHAEK